MTLLRSFVKNHAREEIPSEFALNIGPAGAAEVLAALSLCPNYKPSPLVELGQLAREKGVGAIFYKDESTRLGLNSFKALGGAYAVIRSILNAAEKELNRPVLNSELLDPAVKDIARNMTFAAATDGNHGLAVAAGARLCGARSIIYVHQAVASQKIQHIVDYGATVSVVDGGYDASVEQMERDAAKNGWVLISDTHDKGDAATPLTVMQGYSVIGKELLDQTRSINRMPTHVFLQAGVGGFAAALTGYFALAMGRDRPEIYVVEPENASCVFQSIVRRAPTELEEKLPTRYAMLECHKPSRIAWSILQSCADGVITISEDDAISGVDPTIVTSDSGAAGLIGFLKAVDNNFIPSLNKDAVVLVVGTEGR